MTIGGPSGIGGPNGPTAPGELAEPDAIEGGDELERVADAGQLEGAAGPDSTADIDRLAAEVAAGRMTPREAIEHLVDVTATPDLSPAERAELRELMAELVANDPYFAGLTDRI